MKQPLWVPSDERRRAANITRFMQAVNAKHGLTLTTYRQLYDWSVASIPEFWALMWEFGGIRASRGFDQVVDDLQTFPGATWFAGARLNFAENLLRFRDDRPALIFRGEASGAARVTYADLSAAVGRLARSFRDIGVGPGDRVAGYMPNLIETVVGMLAATSVGAVWASCATDLGPSAALDRLGQIAPKVLLTADGYVYRGTPFPTLAAAAAVARGISSLAQVVVVSYLAQRPDLAAIPRAVHYDDFLAPQPSAVTFDQLPFDHPVYIMFSSGTTGKPKCMVQSAGGVLINHLKELILHTDLKRDNVITYITSCSWMMWNWLVSSLAVGATVVLYDGHPTYPETGAMWRLVQSERVTIFGTSASYLNALRASGARPGREFDVSSLREISQTGSPLSAEGFEYVYREIKRDLHFNSISGGTDINGCFACGNPISPVYAGELQGPALAMKISAYDDRGRAVLDRQGELVCEAPSPSMPMRFWNDPDGRKYRDAYFAFYPQTSVWRHGDFIEIHSDTGGITFYGRSDTVLKPSGVRIGTAEIYRVVEQIAGVADSVAVGQNLGGDQRIILFVKLVEGITLTAQLQEVIRTRLRKEASPRHVPAVIVAVPDIPYTYNMKKVEGAVANIVNGRPVTNREALVNPEVLVYFEQLLPTLREDTARTGG
jgi:acetoacetyl-CoA synthetase